MELETDVSRGKQGLLALLTTAASRRTEQRKAQGLKLGGDGDFCWRGEGDNIFQSQGEQVEGKLTGRGRYPKEHVAERSHK